MEKLTLDMIEKVEDKQSFFDVQVEIYSSTKCSDLNTFKTGIPMSEWFSQDNHLITVNSSISQ